MPTSVHKLQYSPIVPVPYWILQLQYVQKVTQKDIKMTPGNKNLPIMPDSLPDDQCCPLLISQEEIQERVPLNFQGYLFIQSILIL